MTIDDVRLLYEYDRWANHRIIQAASDLTAEQFTRDLGGAFSSLRDTVLHIIAGEWTWLEYWKAPSPTPAFLAELRTRRQALFNPSSHPSVVEVRSKWAEVEAEQVQFVSRLTDELIQRMVPFRTTQVPLAQLMQHVSNHSTYHRGQISLMMRQLGAKPVATDFHEFLVDEQRSTASADKQSPATHTPVRR